MTENLKRSTRIESLYGLRGLALLLVILVHFGAFAFKIVSPIVWFSYGVPLFYILSGFLITKNIIEKDITQAKFLYSRGVALLPAYWISIIIVVVLTKPYFVLTTNGIKILVFHFLGLQTFIKDIGGAINGTLWMFGIIFYFYIFISFFLKRIKQGKIINLCILMIVLAICWRIGVFLFVESGSDKAHYGLKFLSPIDNIFIGVLMAVFYKQKSDVFYTLNIKKVAGLLVLSIIFLIIIQYYFLIKPKSYWDSAGSVIIFPSLKAILLGVVSYAIIRLDDFQLTAKLFRLSGLDFLGKVSYSAYLFHIPIIVSLANFAKANQISNTILALGIVVSIVIFSYIYQLTVVDKFRNLNRS